mmetsp:Transcript_49872/g.142684  ORF Transcript_49872/g.142684 Transcript_49872/m.142684 type:complete len:213 (-) Transcript_49872:289-927(-)
MWSWQKTKDMRTIVMFQPWWKIQSLPGCTRTVLLISRKPRQATPAALMMGEHQQSMQCPSSTTNGVPQRSRRGAAPTTGVLPSGCRRFAIAQGRTSSSSRPLTHSFSWSQCHPQALHPGGRSRGRGAIPRPGIGCRGRGRTARPDHQPVQRKSSPTCLAEPTSSSSPSCQSCTVRTRVAALQTLWPARASQKRRPACRRTPRPARRRRSRPP